MANQPETPTWDAGVYQIETTDPVEGGLGGIANASLLNLANRTLYLKTFIESILAPIISGKGWVLFDDIVSNIPAGWVEVTDMQGKFPIGQNMADATMNAIGQNGGAKTTSVAQANLPPHEHLMFTQEQLDDPVIGTSDTYKIATQPNNRVAPYVASGGGFAYSMVKSSSNAMPSAGRTGNGPGTSTALNVMNPYRVVMYIKWVGP